MELLVARLRTPPGGTVMCSGSFEKHGSFGVTNVSEDLKFDGWRWEERVKFRSGLSAEPTKKIASVEANAAAVTPGLDRLEALRTSASLTINTSAAQWKYSDFGLWATKKKDRK